jgi:hypothetical protein
MGKIQSSSQAPIPVTRALRKLGHDIRDAGGGVFLLRF